MISAAPQPAIQTSLDDLGTPLAEVTFVVVDLETTGGRPGDEAITEIGAVKVRGGEVLGEFATLVNPGHSIPVQIERLTGITTSMVCDAPRIRSVLPQFLKFLGAESIVVAHNARFDTSFLTAAARGLGLSFTPAGVVDTLSLARGLVPHGEVPNHKLGTLAAHFGATTIPTHRALADARATVDVLHALLGRAGSLGIVGLEDLLHYSARVPAHRRRKTSLADGLPETPGVYVFRDSTGAPLYVGTSRNIKQRVRTYFTASESRRRMGEMVDLAVSVSPIPCPTSLEAQIREIRLIAEYRPPYNRRSKRPEKAVWLKLTHERFPRLSIVRTRGLDVASYLGPFRSRALAEQARDAIHAVRQIRQCSMPISAKTRANPCVLAELGRCMAPCTGAVSPESYAAQIAPLRHEFVASSTSLVTDLEERVGSLAADERFESARQARDNLMSLLEGLDRAQRQAPLLAAEEFVAARPSSLGGWEFVSIAHGHLAGTARCPRGLDPRPVIDSLRLTRQSIDIHSTLLPEETDLLLRWLERPGTRVVESSQPWVCPSDAARPHVERLTHVIRRAREHEHARALSQ